MNTVVKVCDAIELVTFSAATMAPSWFSCGITDTTKADRGGDDPVGQHTQKNYQNRHSGAQQQYEPDYLVENHSFRLDREYNDNNSGDSYRWRKKTREGCTKSRPLPWARRAFKHADAEDDEDDDKAYGSHSRSWENKNHKKRPPRSSTSKPMLARSKQELPKPTQHYYNKSGCQTNTDADFGFGVGFDDDDTYGTFSTYDETYFDDGSILGRTPPLVVRTTGQDAASYDDNDGTTNNNKNNKAGFLRFDDNKIGLDMHDMPMHWTPVVKKQSSWETDSSKHNNSSQRYMGFFPKNTHDVSSSVAPNNFLHDSSLNEQQYHRGNSSKNKNKSLKYNNNNNSSNSNNYNVGTMDINDWEGGSLTNNPIAMTRDLPSFGKSREFRSFGSNRSKGDCSSSYSLKPTYITADESKLLHEEYNRYNYIIAPTTSSSNMTAATTTDDGDSSGTSTTVSITTPSTTPCRSSSSTSSLSLSTASSAPKPIQKKTNPKTKTALKNHANTNKRNINGNNERTFVSSSLLKRNSFERVFRNKRSPFPVFFKKTQQLQQRDNHHTGGFVGAN